MFKQAAIPVQDKTRFEEVKAALERVFAASNVAGYLERLKRSKLRARDFEGILARGLLGETAARSYEALGASDRGQIREFYLSLVERVAPELRVKYLKSYAYY